MPINTEGVRFSAQESELKTSAQIKAMTELNTSYVKALESFATLSEIPAHEELASVKRLLSANPSRTDLCLNLSVDDTAETDERELTGSQVKQLIKADETCYHYPHLRNYIMHRDNPSCVTTRKEMDEVLNREREEIYQFTKDMVDQFEAPISTCPAPVTGGFTKYHNGKSLETLCLPVVVMRSDQWQNTSPELRKAWIQACQVIHGDAFGICLTDRHPFSSAMLTATPPMSLKALACDSDEDSRTELRYSLYNLAEIKGTNGWTRFPSWSNQKLSQLY